MNMEEKAKATHSSALAWKIPWMEEPSRLQSRVEKSLNPFSSRKDATEFRMRTPEFLYYALLDSFT